MPKKNYKKEIIVSARKELIKKGYDNLNMRAIAKGAGIKAASLYNHFKNKDEIIYELILEGRILLANNIRAAIDKYDQPEDKIASYFDSFIDFGFNNIEYYKIMFMNSYPEESMEKVKNEIAREIEPGLKTLTALIHEYTNLSPEKSMTLAESFFHIVHGHISLSILERADFMFNISETRKKIKELIMNYLLVESDNSFN